MTTAVTELVSVEELAADLDVPVDVLETLVTVEWAAAGQAWPALRERRPERQDLSLDDVVALVETAAPRLTAAGIATMLPARLAQRHTTRRRYRVQGQPAGLDVANLVLTGEVRVGDATLTQADLDALLHSRHDLVALDGRWVFLAEGERARIADFVRRFGVTDAAAVLEAAADTEEEPDVELEVDVAPASWLARALTGTWKPEPAERVPVPDAVRVPLRDYQRDGLDWMVWLERNGLGGILADDMGLGKTAMLLALVAHDHEGPTLVVAPTSVVGNWVREAERFTPSLRVAVHHGEDRGDPVDTAAERRPRTHDLRPPPARRAPEPGEVAPGGGRRGPGPQERRHRDREGGPRDHGAPPRGRHGHAGGEPPRRALEHHVVRQPGAAVEPPRLRRARTASVRATRAPTRSGSSTSTAASPPSSAGARRPIRGSSTSCPSGSWSATTAS